jgi:hypothetical protein
VTVKARFKRETGRPQMILLRDPSQSGINFYYPWSKKGHSVRVVPWSTYRKWLRLRAGSNVLLFICGLLLCHAAFYTDDRFNVYATIVLVSTASRLWFFYPRAKLELSQSTSTQWLPIAGLDFSGSFFVIAVMQLAYESQPDPGPDGPITASLSWGTFALAILTICPAIFYALGKGRLRAR